MKKIVLIILITFSLISCDEKRKKRYEEENKKHTIEVYSGGVKVKEYTSPKMPDIFSSNGYCQFTNDKGIFITIKGDIIITRNTKEKLK